MRFFSPTSDSYIYLLYLASLLVAPAAAADEKPLKPCTAKSPSSGRFFDLNPIWSKPIPDPAPKKLAKDQKEESWHARGYDIGYNFTINFCGPVVEDIEDVVGVGKSNWGNVSAYYEKDGDVFSLGSENATPVFRGRKLVLTYTGGSPCGDFSSKDRRKREMKDGKGHKDEDGDDEKDGKDKDEDGDKDEKKKGDGKRRKQTVISLLCENDATAPQAALSFVAASDDQCSYFFEARSMAACPIVEVQAQTLGPGGVFGVILFIAIAAYLIGGCVYQRNVQHQRGWRQLPNYSLWAGIWGFISDFFIILTSSCARFLPSRRGYSRVSLGNGRPNGRGRSGSQHSDDSENRLIDQLDEEWDD